MRVLSVLGLVSVMATALNGGMARADLYGELTPKEQAAINRGEQVLKTPDVAGSVWPRIIVYQRFEATPEEMMGVLFDYALQKDIFDGLIYSTPEFPGAAETNVDFVMRFPKVMGISLPDEHYTAHEMLSTYGNSGYQLAWTMIRATSMQDCNGSARMERLGNGTMVRYDSFIKPPKPALAKLIVKMAVDKVRQTVQDLGNWTIKERDTNPALLDAQKATLAKALGQ